MVVKVIEGGEKMSSEDMCKYYIRGLNIDLPRITFAERVQMIHKLLKVINQTLDGMEAEVKKECP